MEKINLNEMRRLAGITSAHEHWNLHESPEARADLERFVWDNMPDVQKKEEDGKRLLLGGPGQKAPPRCLAELPDDVLRDIAKGMGYERKESVQEAAPSYDMPTVKATAQIIPSLLTNLVSQFESPKARDANLSMVLSAVATLLDAAGYKHDAGTVRQINLKTAPAPVQTAAKVKAPSSSDSAWVEQHSKLQSVGTRWLSKEDWAKSMRAFLGMVSNGEDEDSYNDLSVKRVLSWMGSWEKRYPQAKFSYLCAREMSPAVYVAITGQDASEALQKMAASKAAGADEVGLVNPPAGSPSSPSVSVVRVWFD